MINVRRGTFETNSSSTHSICICKEDRGISIPERLEVNLKDYEFGWECDKYNITEEKLAYIMFGLLSRSYNEGFVSACKEIKQLLDTIGQWVKSVHIEGLEVVVYGGHSYLSEVEGYVDHANEMGELIEALLEDEDLLKRYLFSSDSVIFTGNDNEDDDVTPSLPYEFDEFYKGN